MWTDAVPSSLPTGQLITPDPGFAETDDVGPVMWMTRTPVDGSIALWRRLWATRSLTGLYPLILPERSGLEGRPWIDGELCPVKWSDVEEFDVDAFFSERWGALVADISADRLAWTGRESGPWSGLTEPASFDVNPDDPSDLLDDLPFEFDQCRVGLVPAATGSEALATVGWLGAINHYDSVAPLAAIVHSWEQRFGFRLVSLGFDQMIGSHACRPVADAQAIGLEHYLTCPDELDQNFGGDVTTYLKDISESPGWGLWWD